MKRIISLSSIILMLVFITTLNAQASSRSSRQAQVSRDSQSKQTSMNKALEAEQEQQKQTVTKKTVKYIKVTDPKPEEQKQTRSKNRNSNNVARQETKQPVQQQTVQRDNYSSAPVRRNSNVRHTRRELNQQNEQPAADKEADKPSQPARQTRRDLNTAPQPSINNNQTSRSERNINPEKEKETAEPQRRANLQTNQTVVDNSQVQKPAQTSREKSARSDDAKPNKTEFITFSGSDNSASGVSQNGAHGSPNLDGQRIRPTGNHNPATDSEPPHHPGGGGYNPNDNEDHDHHGDYDHNGHDNWHGDYDHGHNDNWYGDNDHNHHYNWNHHPNYRNWYWNFYFGWDWTYNTTYFGWHYRNTYWTWHHLPAGWNYDHSFYIFTYYDYPYVNYWYPSYYWIDNPVVPFNYTWNNDYVEARGFMLADDWDYNPRTELWMRYDISPDDYYNVHPYTDDCPIDGYGIVTPVARDTYAYYHFDNYGNRLARQILRDYKGSSNKIYIEVKGFLDRETHTMNVTSLKRVKWYNPSHLSIIFFPRWFHYRPYFWG